jgi:hypothetical protein
MFSSVGCWEIPQARTAARAELGPLGVKMRNPHCEQMFSTLLPTHEVAALQPAAREQEPRGR